MQMKLTEEQIDQLKQARALILEGFGWSESVEGDSYWVGVIDKIDDKIKHGTSDGKPYVEPEPPIPEGYRKANADECKRWDVKFWHLPQREWVRRPIQGDPFDPPECNTHYIVPIDQPLTDEDACVWPRRLVMVRDEYRHPWIGPYKYLGKTDASYSIDPDNGGCATDWKQARPATPEEIEKASNKT